MKTQQLTIGIIALTLLYVPAVTAQSRPECDRVLIPTEERTKSDYSLIQAFMRVNAAEEYDRLKSMSNEGRAADASYKLFSASYDESRNKEEFQEKIRKRLEVEKFVMDEKDARSHYRRFLTSAQIKAWTTCVTQQNGGAVLLAPSEIDGNGFLLYVGWVPPNGVPTKEITLTFTGGATSGQKEYKKGLEGRYEFTIPIEPTSNAKTIKVIANAGGYTASLSVKLDHTATVTDGKVATPCVLPPMALDFDGDNCPDNFVVDGEKVRITYANGRSLRIPENNDAYDASLGQWYAGDFDGDGVTDLVHIVTRGPATHNHYAHVHFGKRGGGFQPPTGDFSFPGNANPQHDYNTTLGYWYVKDVNGDGATDLVHNPGLRDGRIHYWYSLKDGRFQLH